MASWLLIIIDGTFYRLERNGRAWRLHKCHGTTPAGVVYDIGMSEFGPTCDCPDAIFRPNREEVCKHVAALREQLLV